MAQINQTFRSWLKYRRFLFVFALLLQIGPVAAALCYTPDGTISKDRPCDPSASASVCCTQGFLCTSNKLCQPAHWWDGTDGNPLQFIRGTCTDKTWAAPECQSHCVAENPGGGEWVMRCGNNSDNYCCSADDCCTRASFIKFTLDEPTITATAGIKPTTDVATTSSTETPTETPISSVTTTTSTSTAPTLVPSPSSTSETSPPSSTISTTQPPPVTSTETDPSKPSTKTTTAIGIGVGVGVGIVLLSLIIGIVIFRMRRRRKRAAQQAETMQTRYHSDTKYLRQVPLEELDTRQPLEAIAELDGGSSRGNGNGRGRIAELQ